MSISIANIAKLISEVVLTKMTGRENKNKTKSLVSVRTKFGIKNKNVWDHQ